MRIEGNWLFDALFSLAGLVRKLELGDGVRDRDVERDVDLDRFCAMVEVSFNEWDCPDEGASS